MKKIFIIFMLLAASVAIMPKSFAYDAWGQAQQANEDGQSAVDSNSDEGARSYSGYTFDTPSTTPPVVDLRGAGEHPTPQLLRTSDDNDNPYIPKQYRSLHTTPPPLP